MSVAPARRSGLTNGATDKNNHAKTVNSVHQGKVYQQTFNAPGTWTWPGICSTVEVLVVSGGGGGASGPGTTAPTATTSVSFAGGGGVNVFMAPVTGPVPVTVGAGGTAGVWAPAGAPIVNGGNGGASGFGPVTPPVPTATAWIEGGQGAGLTNMPTYPYANGGGVNSDGGGNPSLSPVSYRTANNIGGTSPGNFGSSAGAGDTVDPWGTVRYSYGGGGRNGTTDIVKYGRAALASSINASFTHNANTGHGGVSYAAFSPLVPIPVAMTGLDGSSGTVIVRWIE